MEKWDAFTDWLSVKWQALVSLIVTVAVGAKIALARSRVWLFVLWNLATRKELRSRFYVWWAVVFVGGMVAMIAVAAIQGHTFWYLTDLIVGAIAWHVLRTIYIRAKILRHGPITQSWLADYLVKGGLLKDVSAFHIAGKVAKHWNENPGMEDLQDGDLRDLPVPSRNGR